MYMQAIYTLEYDWQISSSWVNSHSSPHMKFKFKVKLCITIIVYAQNHIFTQVQLVLQDSSWLYIEHQPVMHVHIFTFTSRFSIHLKAHHSKDSIQRPRPACLSLSTTSLTLSSPSSSLSLSPTPGRVHLECSQRLASRLCTPGRVHLECSQRLASRLCTPIQTCIK